MKTHYKQINGWHSDIFWPRKNTNKLGNACVIIFISNSLIWLLIPDLIPHKLCLKKKLICTGVAYWVGNMSPIWIYAHLIIGIHTPYFNELFDHSTLPVMDIPISPSPKCTKCLINRFLKRWHFERFLIMRQRVVFGTLSNIVSTLNTGSIDWMCIAKVMFNSYSRSPYLSVECIFYIA